MQDHPSLPWLECLSLDLYHLLFSCSVSCVAVCALTYVCARQRPPEPHMVQTPVSLPPMLLCEDEQGGRRSRYFSSLDQTDPKAGSGTADAARDSYPTACTERARRPARPVRTSVLWGSGQVEAGLQAPSLTSRQLSHQGSPQSHVNTTHSSQHQPLPPGSAGALSFCSPCQGSRAGTGSRVPNAGCSFVQPVC